MPSFVVRPAITSDLTAIKKIADANKSALGFLPRPKISQAIEQQRLLVLQAEQELTGFVIYRHRKTDKQTTLYDICVAESWRGVKGGHTLIQALVQECVERSREFILLKCPVELSANYFYKKTGFVQIGRENGKHRSLNIWRLDIDSSEAV